jgi:hypothetical protein
MSRDAYADAWADCRRRQRFALAVILGFVPGVFALASVLGLLTGGRVPFLAVGAGWFVLWFIAIIWMHSFPCPRCHRPFFQTIWYGNPLAQRCLHCGLPKWSSVMAESTHQVEP